MSEDASVQWASLTLPSSLQLGARHSAVQCIQAVCSGTSGINQETNLSILNILDSLCLMDQGPTQWIKACRKDLYLAFCRELVLLMEYLDKHRLLLGNDKGSMAATLNHKYHDQIWYSRQTTERQECSVVNGEGWPCSPCSFPITFSLPDVRPHIGILFLLCGI